MARTNEWSEDANSLPQPELNPLLNPLLADNMGRWAEVYFTSPPERREEAVLELVRELERAQGQAEIAASPAPLRSAYPGPPTTAPLAEDKRSASCNSCGHKNPVTHQFCGMCGSKLADNSLQHDPMENLRASIERLPDDKLEGAEGTDPGGEGGESDVRTPSPAVHTSAAPNSDLSLFRSLRTPDVQKGLDHEPPRSSRYRLYIGAVLALVVLVLGYMAWGGRQTTQSSHEGLPPPPAGATEAAPTVAGPSSPAAKNAEAAPTSPNPATERSRHEVGRRTSPQASPETTLPEQTSSANGVTELAMAQRYLNGTGGQARDSSEAAKWLWKSMAKHNGQATILLADLYLKGDGVPKNCDQGRLLLDAAAQKGIPGAGERLRNLQAFGCR